MSDFRSLTDHVIVSPQITVEDVAKAASLGVQLIVNNRPEGEEDNQTPGGAIQAAAEAAGLAYLAIPISPGQFGEVQIDAMREALEKVDGPVLAYCRTGTRSTLLWSLTEATKGGDLNAVAAAAAQAGYDISPILPLAIRLNEAAPS